MYYGQLLIRSQTKLLRLSGNQYDLFFLPTSEYWPDGFPFPLSLNSCVICLAEENIPQHEEAILFKLLYHLSHIFTSADLLPMFSAFLLVTVNGEVLSFFVSRSPHGHWLPFSLLKISLTDISSVFCIIQFSFFILLLTSEYPSSKHVYPQLLLILCSPFRWKF